LPKGAGPSTGAAPDKLSLLSAYLGHGIAGLGGYLLGGVHGAIEGTGGYTLARGAVDALKRAGIERTDQLLTEALLNPELAKTLLMKASPENRVFIAQRLGSHLGTLATSAGVQAAGERRGSDKPAQVAPISPPTRPAPFNPAMPMPGSLVPGGVLRP
jgi:hypothetical protein